MMNLAPGYDTKNVEIHINNFKNYESVNYSLVRLHGSIRLNNNVFSAINDIIEVFTPNNTSVVWPVAKGLFKCLIQLDPGCNKILLSHQEISKEFFINFKVHETDRCVVPIYFIPANHDGCFQAPKGVDNSVDSALARIGLGMKMIQSLFAEKLHERSYPRKSFQLEIDLSPESQPCRQFKSSLTTAQVVKMNEEELWEEVARELMMSSLGNDNKKYICFICCTLWNGLEVSANPALGGGGLALLGSGSLHTWPTSLSEVVSALTNSEKLGPHLLDNSCFRGTYCGAFATSLGSAAHEMGHTFNLGHTRSGLMARGFDNTHLVFIELPTDADKEKTCDELVPCLSVAVEGTSDTRTLNKTSIQHIRPERGELTFLEPGCAAILAHHPWFNPDSQTVPIRYNRLRHIVESEGASLKVVQVRGEQGAVRRSWELQGSGKQLVVPTGHEGATLVAINSVGTILVEDL